MCHFKMLIKPYLKILYLNGVNLFLYSQECRKTMILFIHIFWELALFARLCVGLSKLVDFGSAKFKVDFVSLKVDKKIYFGGQKVDVKDTPVT